MGVESCMRERERERERASSEKLRTKNGFRERELYQKRKRELYRKKKERAYNKGVG